MLKMRRVLAVFILAGVPMAPSGAKETVVYAFQGGNADGFEPNGGLIEVGGTLYGTTFAGGSFGYGTVFSITTAGVEKVIYSFKGGMDGANPQAGLISVDGLLYGTTRYGGEYGKGTIFSITTLGAENLIYTFKGGADSANPTASLTYVNGTFYGTTNGGGVDCGCGTVFSVTPSGAEAVLHVFGTGSDGQYPDAELINVNGVLFGTTILGGAGCHDKAKCGTMFSITPSGVETIVHYFLGHPNHDGIEPYAGLINVDSTLYGTTAGGGVRNFGTAFSVTPSGAETELFSFRGRDGTGPGGTLIDVGGTLYGAAGGGRHGIGEVFSVSLAGVESVLYSFKGGSDGSGPNGGLIYLDNKFFGTTLYGGGSGCPQGDGCGTVFSVTP